MEHWCPNRDHNRIDDHAAHHPVNLIVGNGYLAPKRVGEGKVAKDQT